MYKASEFFFSFFSIIIIHPKKKPKIWNQIPSFKYVLSKSTDNNLQSTHVYTPNYTKKKKTHHKKCALPLKSLVLPQLHARKIWLPSEILRVPRQWSNCLHFAISDLNRIKCKRKTTAYYNNDQQIWQLHHCNTVTKLNHATHLSLKRFHKVIL